MSIGTLAVTHANALGSTAGGTEVASGATLDILGAVGAEPVTLNGGTLKNSTGTGSLSGTVALAAVAGEWLANIGGTIGSGFPGVKSIRTVLVRIGRARKRK